MSFDQQHLRMVEALLFAASEPLDMESIRARLPNDLDVPAVLEILEGKYRERGVNVVQIAGKCPNQPFALLSSSSADLSHRNPLGLLKTLLFFYFYVSF